MASPQSNVLGQVSFLLRSDYFLGFLYGVYFKLFLQMKLFIFEYDNEVDLRDTAWAMAETEQDARIKALSRIEFNVAGKPLGRKYKVVATFTLADDQKPVKALETTKESIPDWIEEAAYACHRYAMEHAGHMRGKCIWRQAAFADLIRKHKPKPDPDWIEAAAKETTEHVDGVLPGWSDYKELVVTHSAIIRKHAPK